VYPEPAIWAIVERMAHWQAAWEMFVDHPVVGVGPGHYVVAYPDYAVLPYWKDPLGHAHNVYLNIAAEEGFLGLVAYLAMLVSWVWLGLTLVRRLAKSAGRGLDRAVAAGALACVVAAAMHNVFDNLYVHGMNAHVGLLLGLLSSVWLAGRRGATDGEAERQSTIAAIEVGNK
jgi:O-antigen ligase